MQAPIPGITKQGCPARKAADPEFDYYLVPVTKKRSRDLNPLYNLENSEGLVTPCNNLEKIYPVLR